MLVLRALVCGALYTSVTRLQNIYVQSENISNGKYAKQSSTHMTYGASRALNKAYMSSGSATGLSNPSWWEVDLRGYFTISSITLTAATFGGWNVHMRNAEVVVMDKDVSLCSDVQSEWCGNVSSTVTAGEEFTFTCNATFPVRFVRVTRPSTTNVYLDIGHVDVQGEGAKKPYRSYYKPSKNKKVSQPFLTTSAMTAGNCGIICHQYHSCIDFSYSATIPTDENCLLADKAMTLSDDNSWTTYTISCSYYKPSKNKKMSQPFLTTSAMTAGHDVASFVTNIIHALIISATMLRSRLMRNISLMTKCYLISIYNC